MPVENARKYNPPYISPLSFNHLMERLQENMPGRFDRSFLDTMFSGSSGIQVMAALRFLNLVDANNVPTSRLRALVESRDDEYQRRLRETCTNAYSAIFTDIHFNLQTATFQQLEEIFTERYGVDGDVRRKCIKFFTSISGDAGIKLSPFITQKVRTAPARSSPKLPVKKAPVKNSKQVPAPIVEKPNQDFSLLEKLLDKFPSFENEWTNDQKKQWLDSFMLFLQKIYPEFDK